MKLHNGFQKFPAVFNIEDLEVVDFHNGDLSQGILSDLYSHKYQLTCRI